MQTIADKVPVTEDQWHRRFAIFANVGTSEGKPVRVWFDSYECRVTQRGSFQTTERRPLNHAELPDFEPYSDTDLDPMNL